MSEDVYQRGFARMRELQQGIAEGRLASGVPMGAREAGVDALTGAPILAAQAPEGCVRMYGSVFPRSGNPLQTELEIESFCFRTGRTEAEGGLGKFGHFKKIVDLLWNNPLVRSPKQFVWNPWAEAMLRAACEQRYLGIAGCASAGKSDPFALWALVNYLTDPTHTLIIVMSTTLAGAKLRIWKTIMEYWAGVPNLPGKLVSSKNMIRGLNYNRDGLSDSSGIILMASEKAKEREAIDKIIGIKSPKTHGEGGREGKLMLIVDEMTGMAESILHAAQTNLDSNRNFQMIGLGNPNSRLDPFGLFCTPDEGWKSITEDSTVWKTSRGMCLRFDGEKNPRVELGDDSFGWMLSREQMAQFAKDYGRDSLFYYRMVRGFWAPQGAMSGVYAEADFVDAMEVEEWAPHADPIPVAALDPSFTSGGDRCMAYFGYYGEFASGVWGLLFAESVPLKENIQDRTMSRSVQIARLYRQECEARGVRVENACYDATGGGGPFGDSLFDHWGKCVAIKFAGAPTTRLVSLTDRVPAGDRFYNRMSELWFGMQPFLKSGQIRGVTPALANELCSREFSASEGIRALIQVEPKSKFRSRVGKSPDLADAALMLVELCRNRFGFRVTGETGGSIAWNPRGSGKQPVRWKDFVKRTTLKSRNLR